MRIYVAGPYTADTDEQIMDNIHDALDAGIALMDKGHDPFIPHLSHWIEKRAVRSGRGGIQYRKWMEYGFAWLAVCDALVFIGESPGACEERTWATRIGLKVYDGLSEVPLAWEDQ